MESAYRYCEQLVRAADKDRFLSALFAPAERRDALFALYAFDIEVAGVRQRVREPMAGEVRLQWWREAIGGERAGEAAANPVATALLDTVARCALPIEPLLKLIEARAFDLYDDAMPSLAAFDAYLDATSSALIALAGRILAGNHPAIEDAARPAGRAYAIAGLLRAPRPSLPFPDLRARARAEFAAFEAMLPRLPAAAAPAFLPAALVPGDLADRTPAQWRRQFTLWRAARRYAGAMKC